MAPEAREFHASGRRLYQLHLIPGCLFQMLGSDSRARQRNLGWKASNSTVYPNSSQSAHGFKQDYKLLLGIKESENKLGILDKITFSASRDTGRYGQQLLIVLGDM